MKYPRIMLEFFGTVWAISEDKYRQIRSILLTRNAGIKAFDEELDAAAAVKRTGGYQTVGKVAIIPIMGVIHHRAGAMEEASGGIGAEAIGQQFDAAIADKSVNRIVLQIDSPGGSVFGVPELAEKIRKGREVKKVIAVADPVAASAAYWLGSQASEFYVSPSGQVGSLGVIAEHTDFSKAEEADGIKTTVIKSAEFKQEAHSSFPLSSEAALHLQTQVNQYHQSFLSAVAKGRGVSVAKVSVDFGQGRMLMADDARSAGMVDGIASMEAVMRRLGAEISKTAAMARARAVEVS
jgi:signal peptide peptidase SppA